MKLEKYLTVLVLALTVIAFSFCDNKDDVIEPPEAFFVVSPENGLTTNTFTFNTSGTTNPGLEKPDLFFRWDWNGDGSWDTHFSKAKEYEHRFFSAGEYITHMEVRNAFGLTDTITKSINVQKGNSAPVPSLFVDPLFGHMRTQFVFDASATYDDEDSIQTLRFRWDWDGNGIYDTPYSNNPIAEHVFNEPGSYHVIMQVTDPLGVWAIANLLIDITTQNPKLFVDFTWTPENGTTSDVITLDASSCHDPDDPGNVLQYRWDLDNDNIFDTEWSDDPILEEIFKEEGEREIKLEIQDQFGLTKSVVKKIFVYHSNQPPVASFITGTSYGNLTTEFYFDAEAVRDDEDFFNILEVRWDFQSDGVYDTEYSMTKTARHFYGVAGDFTVTMQVKDSGGLTDTISSVIHISSGTNQTDLVIDQDHGTMYGTVKIGDQWWTSENVDATAGSTCYRNIQSYCDTYGGLYTWSTAMNNSTSEKARGICPNGWHVPTTDEWVELFTFLGEENARTELEVGGSTDFRMLYGGQIDPSGTSGHLGSVVNFWTSSRVVGDNAWAYSLQAGKDQIWKITIGQSYRISVRCIKN